MEKLEKGKEIASIVFKFIWIFFAIAMWVIGLVFFVMSFDGSEAETMNAIMTYFIWGGLCAVCNIVEVLRDAFAEGRKGARRGANDYTISSDGLGNVTVANHPIRDAIIGFIGGILAGVIIGPVLIPIKIIRAIIDVVKMIVSLKKAA